MESQTLEVACLQCSGEDDAVSCLTIEKEEDEEEMSVSEQLKGPAVAIHLLDRAGNADNCVLCLFVGC